MNDLWQRLQSDRFQIRAHDGEGDIISIEQTTSWGPLVVGGIVNLRG